MVAFYVVVASAVVLAAYAFYKYKTVAGIEAELKAIETAGVTDVKSVIASIKAKL
jgi:hypothetical protein